MAKQRVLLLGAHGETGETILEGLLKDGNFEVSALVQPSSVAKPTVQALAARNIPLVVADIKGPQDALVEAITGFDTIISTIGPASQLAQIPLVDAAAKAGIKRFVPCAFLTVCPPDGVMTLRSDKEKVYHRIWKHRLPYTIIDVGFWHQLSVFSVPSGKLNYGLLLDHKEIYGDGNTKSLLTDMRDIGSYVAKIIKDPRTLNQKVFTWSDELSQNDVIQMIVQKTGEKPVTKQIPDTEMYAAITRANAAIEKDASNVQAWILLTETEYNVSKHIRGDNTAAVAKYLGYLDAKELYPEFEPIPFEHFLDELVTGQAKKPYSVTNPDLIKMFHVGEDGLYALDTNTVV
ncbi:NAD(P)-binding protein [Periconia macrospinosa]|uniref:NAD(P)-binding protein n=1 Tax=Periconia macrospinosa TaxID=97972 RepID=A0A2V1D013_9PLEO|nr:NAD(P)-binding protein [Periconia macrospinosa]